MKTDVTTEKGGFADQDYGRKDADPFAAAVRATQAPIVISNPRLDDNPVIFVNDAFCRMTGYARADVLGRNCRFLQGPETDRATVAQIREAINGGAPVQVDLRNHRKDGALFWNRLAINPVPGADGGIDYFVASQSDVTLEVEHVPHLEARNDALLVTLAGRLAALEESEASLRLATEAAEIGTWDVDLTTNIMTVSERARLIFGLPYAGAHPLADVTARIHPEDRTSRAKAFAAMISPARRSLYDVEARTVYQEDGSFRWVALKGKGLFTPEGQSVSAYGTAIDITARKQDQARQMVLLAVAERIRKLTDVAQIASAVRDVLGSYFDTAHLGFAALSPEDAAAFDGADNRTEAGALLAALTPVMRAYLAEGEALVCGEPKNGPRHPCPACEAVGVQTLLILPLLRDGVLAALIYVGQTQQRRWSTGDRSLAELVAARGWDAMERSRAEAALRELNATLESRVRERTAELQNAEESLRQAQKMEAIGQLTGGIAHDFNNLLTGIVGSLDMLQRRIAEGRIEGIQRYASMAVTAAQRAGALTQRLLAFARRQPLDPRPTDVNALIAGMDELLRRTLGPAVVLNLVLADGVWPCLCDAHQLESGLLNLAINARDAMPAGGTLAIETANATLDDEAEAVGIRATEYTIIRVTDTGSGMTPDIMTRAFEPFFTTKPIGQGTGLGLSMLYGFAKQSGGHVQIESEIGRGTSFRLLLPRHTGAPAADDRTSPLAAAMAGQDRGAVLVVDDENAVRMLVVETLAECGFTILEAADGASGLRILQSDAKVDLLVTDVGLPGLNGRQVADAARALRPALKVLFITGYAHNAAFGNDALEPGMEMMTKPFVLAELAAKVRGMLAPD